MLSQAIVGNPRFWGVENGKANTSLAQSQCMPLWYIDDTHLWGTFYLFVRPWRSDAYPSTAPLGLDYWGHRIASDHPLGDPFCTDRLDGKKRAGFLCLVSRPNHCSLRWVDGLANEPRALGRFNRPAPFLFTLISNSPGTAPAAKQKQRKMIAKKDQPEIAQKLGLRHSICLTKPG